jgi:hypothetical protein
MPSPKEIKMEIPGSFTLDQILFGLIEAEEMKNRNVTEMKVLPDGPDGHRSEATLVKQPVGVPFPQLLLVKVPSAGKLPSIIAAQLADSKKHLFDATIFVENEKTRIAAFR